MPDTLIIVGASTRAAAQSALRAGYSPWCIDLFADRDLMAIAPTVRCPMDQYPEGIPLLLQDAPQAPVLCTGAMENYPEVIEAIERQRPLVGCTATAVRSVREPGALTLVPPVPGLCLCQVHEATPAGGAVAGRRYLVKPRRGAAGVGIRFWTVRQPLDSRHYLQEYVEGTPMSAIFVVDAGAARLFGATEQFIGTPAFGGHGFQYCGGVGPVTLSPRVHAALAYLGGELTQRHGLRGVFGVDFIVHAADQVWPVEVNPRFTASVELIERATGWLGLRYSEALAESASDSGGRVGASQSLRPSHTGLCAKAIVFAKAGCHVPDLWAIFARDAVADVPAVGELTPAGRPICTLFAAGQTRDACLARLHEQAQHLYTRLLP